MANIVKPASRNKTFPVRRAQFDLPRFAAWLAMQGAEIGIPTNAYEVIRYKAYVVGGRKAVTHIVYTKENGLLTFMGSSRGHYEQMLGLSEPEVIACRAAPETVAPAPVKAKGNFPVPRSVTNPTHRSLLARDGDECWFCGLRMGKDITIEHLVAKASKGPNSLANYALAHAKCNQLAADRPLIEKIELRAKMRAANHPTEGAI